MLVAQVMVGGIMAAKLGDHGEISEAYAYYLVIVLVCVYADGFYWSWGPLGWLIPSEIFPLEIRSAGQGTMVAVGFLFIHLVAQTFLSTLCHFQSGLFFFFGGWAAIMTVFVHLLLLEMKNVPIEQMDKIWGGALVLEEDRGRNRCQGQQDGSLTLPLRYSGNHKLTITNTFLLLQSLIIWN
ncbi:hypothetical protein NL676_000169 [Syzygium grande]|nr:hypothetical protein NL676_000169 [Syzygium grande]